MVQSAPHPVGLGAALATVLGSWCVAAPAAMPGPGAATRPAPTRMDAARPRRWRARWEQGITDGARTRYADRELGEELGWLVSPFLNGFLSGYQAAGHRQRVPPPGGG